MGRFEIKQAKILDDLTSVDIGGEHFDLHNNYECFCLRHLIEESKLILSFKTADGSPQKVNKLAIIFNEVEIIKLSLTSGNLQEPMAIDSLYRGRYEVNNTLVEYSPEGKACYYLEFYDGYSFEILAKNLIFQF